jgi:hypothetical protein
MKPLTMMSKGGKKTGLLAPGHPDCRRVRTPVPIVLFSHRFARPHGARAALKVISIEKRGRGRRMPSRRQEEEETPR